MDKLEHYLDQVCRGIAGPKSLRQHIRRELHEHLIDAASEHEAAGMGRDEAISRALDEFGGSEQVRQELLATHGQRVMASVVEKAVQWKEKTMKAKWLWTSWAHLALAGVIAAEVALIGALVTLIVPKEKQYLNDFWIRKTEDVDAVFSWSLRWLDYLYVATDSWAWWVIPLALAWALFEWRCRSENKTMMRLSGMGTAALMLMPAVWLTTAALVLPLAILPDMANARLPEPVVAQHLATADTAVSGLEQSLAIKDWNAALTNASHAWSAVHQLSRMGAAAPVLASESEPARSEEIRAHLDTAKRALGEAREAAWEHHGERLEAALGQWKAARGHFGAPTTRPMK